MNIPFNLQLFAESADVPAEAVDTAQDTLQSHPNTGETALGEGQEPQSTESTVPETYDFTGTVTDVFGEGTELNEEVAGQFAELLRGVNATQEQAAGMAKFGLEFGKNIGQAVAEHIQNAYVEEVKGWGTAAKEELGGNYDSTVASALQTRNYLEQKIPGFTNMLNLTGAGNHVAMIKAMAVMSSLIAEDSGHGANGGMPGGSMYDNTNFKKYQ